MRRHIERLTAVLTDDRTSETRRGTFMVLGLLSLVGTLGFVALSTDLGVVSLTKTRLQNAVDAAALAAAQEITASLESAANNVGNGSGDVSGDVADANAIAVGAARAMAAHVGQLNGVFIDPNVDVKFGKRVYDTTTGAFTVQWGVNPYNVVGVTARRDNPAAGQPDSQLKLFFAPVLGQKTASVSASATAYVEARDIALVLDYSGSMNFDSQLRFDSIAKLGQQAIENNLFDIWQDLGSPTYGNLPFTPDWVTIPGQPASGAIPHIDVTWRTSKVDVVSTKDLSNVVLKFYNGVTQKFDNLSQGKTGTFQGTGYNSGKRIVTIWVKSGNNASGDGPGYGEKFDFYDTATVKRGLGLDNVPYPYPSGSWDNYIDYARDSNGSTSWYSWNIYNAGYRRKFGLLTLINFWLEKKKNYSQTPVLWSTRHYPFRALTDSTTLFTQFLTGLEFGDYLGLVSYATTPRVHFGLTADPQWNVPGVNLGSNPITNDYNAIATIQQHKQAAHYTYTTNIGGGISKGIETLTTYGRYGARPTILLMTDGNANVVDSGWSVPPGWDWNTLTDYDNDGVSDYSTGNSYKLYALVKAKEAADQGITIHTVSIGANADRDLMKAIAFIGKGIYIDVPGGSTIAAMQTQLNTAFAKIAANVPPARLLPNGN